MRGKSGLMFLVMLWLSVSLFFSGCGEKEVTFSELISQAGKYNGKTVTLEAFYFSGFEISALAGSLGPSTYDNRRVVPSGALIWVEGGITEELFKQLYIQVETPSGYAERMGKLKVTGKFETGKKYGHLDAYQYKINLTSAELLEWLPPPESGLTSPPATRTSSPPAAEKAGKKDGTAPVFDGSQWKLVSLDGSPPQAGSYVSLYFRGKTVWGFAGINIYEAEYSLEGTDTLVFSNGLVTLMGGPEDILQQEGQFLRYLQGQVTYRLEGKYLELLSAENGGTAVLERLPEYPMDPAELVGTRWELVSLNGESLREGLSITLVFESGTKASGTAGCFFYQLPYETRLYRPTGDDLRWGIISGRQGELPRELEEQALRYTSSIAWAANYKLEGESLEIYTARGETLVYRLSVGR